MSHVVSAELVASIASVEVVVGQLVGPSDPVCLLESMKMEIPVLAEVSGRIVEIVASPGLVVHEGDPLVIIEEA